MSAAHYINKFGGTNSPVLACLALDLWNWCLQHKIDVEAKYLPGILNTWADKESRVMVDCHDWRLDPQVFSTINQLWEPLDVDLFSSRLTTQLPRFYIWRPDPLAEASDAFTQDWSEGICLPSFCSSGQMLLATVRPECAKCFGTVNTSLAVPAMVSTSLTELYCSVSSVTSLSRSVNPPDRDVPTRDNHQVAGGCYQPILR